MSLLKSIKNKLLLKLLLFSEEWILKQPFPLIESMRGKIDVAI